MSVIESPCPFAVTLLSKGKVIRDDGSTVSLEHSINPVECNFIADIIGNDTAIVKTLEVGCAYGVASLVICWETRNRSGASHVALDPFQTRHFHKCGINHLRQAGLTHFEVLAEFSEFALPRLAQQYEGSYDLVFIDGWHTFDHTLQDLFYANRLLRVGGVIVVDDCTLPGVAKAVSYLTGYPTYRVVGQTRTEGMSLKRRICGLLGRGLIPRPGKWLLPAAAYETLATARYSSMVAVRKTAEDKRPWFWYRPNW
jgi:predicted O-methyltransferase YrrM